MFEVTNTNRNRIVVHKGSFASSADYMTYIQRDGQRYFMDDNYLTAKLDWRLKARFAEAVEWDDVEELETSALQHRQPDVIY